MACVNPDGTISESAQSLLKLLKNPMSDEEISKQMKKPIFLIRVNLRELVGAGLLKEEKNTYSITDRGKEKI